MPASTRSDQTRIPTFTGAFRQNLDAMVGILARGEKDPAGKRIGFELERILLTAEGEPVPFAGEHGVSALLEKLAVDRAEDELVYIDGHLLGMTFDVPTDGEDVTVAISLEPAAQLEVSAGPAHTVKALYDAVHAVDEWIETALPAAGLAGAHLAAIGYDPAVSAPEELTLIPKERYADMDAYLSRRGRYARDMMRWQSSSLS